MTKYLDPSFSSGGNSKKYRDNWDSVFGKKEDNAPESKDQAEEPKRHLRCNFCEFVWEDEGNLCPRCFRSDQG